MFTNKLDEARNMVRNKEIFIEQWYNDQEGINFDDSCALVTGLEVIGILFVYTTYKVSSYIKWMSKIFLKRVYF